MATSNTHNPLPDIPPNPPRWEPSTDPANIHIPGLDTTASVNDQIDHIEQLITIKLQNVDANMSRIQHLMQTRLLPAFKRFAVGTEPVREAARFWTSFYEEAAQVRIPTSDFDLEQPSESQPSTSATQPTQDETTETEEEEEEEVSADVTTNTTIRTERPAQNASSRHFDQTEPPSFTEHSFAPGQAAISSTPATAHRHRVQNPSDTFTTQSSEPSWSASLESPLVRLNRLQDFATDPQMISPSAASTADGESNLFDDGDTIHAARPTTHSRSSSPSPNKRQRRPSDRTLRQDVLRRQTISPHRSRGTKPKTPKGAPPNPYLPKDTDPSKWNGLVDLRSTPLRTGATTTTPRRLPRAAPLPSPAFGGGDDGGDSEGGEGGSDDEDEFGLPPGMSPPVTMAFATMPKVGGGHVSALPKLGRTPSKQAAQRIGRDLIGDSARPVGRDASAYGGGAGASSRMETRGPGGGMVVKSSTDTSLSSATTPPSLMKFMRQSGIGAYPGRGPGMNSSESMVSGSGSSFAAHDSTLDSMMWRIGVDAGGGSGGYDPGAYTRQRQNQAPSTGTVTGLTFGSKASSAGSSRAPVFSEESHNFVPPPSNSNPDLPPANFAPPIPAPVLGHLPTAALTSGHHPHTPDQQNYGAHYEDDGADDGGAYIAPTSRQQMYRDEPTETYNYNVPAHAHQQNQPMDPLTQYNAQAASIDTDEYDRDRVGPGVNVGDDSMDSLDDDEDSIINDTAHPSAAFLLASQQRGVHDQDDSFDSENSADYYDEVGSGEGIEGGRFFNNDDDDSFDDDSFDRAEEREAAELRAAGGGGEMVDDDGWDDDDGFDDDGGGGATETVFGERAARRSVGGQRADYRIMRPQGGEETETMGTDGGTEMMMMGHGRGVPETPTPWMG